MDRGIFEAERSRRKVNFAADTEQPPIEGGLVAPLLENGSDRGRTRPTFARSALLDLLSRGGAVLIEGPRRAMAAFQGMVSALEFGRGQSHPIPADEAESVFGEDYWPGRLAPPGWRIALGLCLSPLAALAPTVLFALLVYFFSESDQAMAWSMTAEAAVDFFSSLYLPLLIGAAVGGAMLWALRLRSRRAYAAIGGGLGAVAGLAVYLVHGALPSVVAAYALASGGLALLALRSIIGVRKLD